MIHWIGVGVTMLYGIFLIYSARRIEVQVDNWIMVLNIMVGGLMLLGIVQPWLAVIGLGLALPVTLLNGQFIFLNINWSHFLVRCFITISLIIMMVKY